MTFRAYLFDSLAVVVIVAVVACCCLLLLLFLFLLLLLLCVRACVRASERVCVAAGGGWQPISAPEEHTQHMRSLWLTSLDACIGHTPITLPEQRQRGSGPVTVTTGLGLPLSRGLASACGGWLALDDSRPNGMTQLWAVLRVTPQATPARTEDTSERPVPLPPPRYLEPEGDDAYVITCAASLWLLLC